MAENDCRDCPMPIENAELRERLAVIETKVQDMQPKLNAMYEIMVQGRGAKRLGQAAFGVGGSAGLGALLYAKWHALLIWLGL